MPPSKLLPHLLYLFDQSGSLFSSLSTHLRTFYLPIPKNSDVVSVPVNACNAGEFVVWRDSNLHRFHAPGLHGAHLIIINFIYRGLII